MVADAIIERCGDTSTRSSPGSSVNNACEHFLLRQSPQATERVGQAFGPTNGERRYLLTCPVGSGPLIAGEQRIPLSVKARPAEHEIVISDPAELTWRLEV